MSDLTIKLPSGRTIVVQAEYYRSSGDGWHEPFDHGGYEIHDISDEDGGKIELTEEEEEFMDNELDKKTRESYYAEVDYPDYFD